MADVQLGRSLVHRTPNQSGRFADRLKPLERLRTIYPLSRPVQSQSHFVPVRSCHQLTSLKNSPSFLAQRRVLRKYHRPHVSRAVERKLYLDSNFRVKRLRTWSALRERNRKVVQDPQMPRLCDVSVVVEKLKQRNGTVHADGPQNDLHSFQHDAVTGTTECISPRTTEAGESMEVQSISLHLSESEDEEDMPHLRRVSTEEKAVETMEKTSDICDIQPIPASMVISKLKTFRSLDEKHHRFSKDLKYKSLIPNEERKQNGENREAVPVHSGHSHVHCKTAKSSGSHPTNGLTARRNVFTIFEKALQTTGLNSCDRSESMPDLTESGEKNSLNSSSPLEMPELDEETDPSKDEISHSVKAVGSKAVKENSLSDKQSTPLFKSAKGPILNLVDNPSLSLIKANAVQPPVLKLAKSVSGGVEDSTWNNGKRRKCAVSSCGVQADLEETSPAQLMSSHPANVAGNDSFSFMSDLAGMKQDREDQTEFYPESLSSLDEELQPKPGKTKKVKYAKPGQRRTSQRDVAIKHRKDPFGTDDDEWTPQNHWQGHKTVDGSPSSLETSQPIKARERRQRPRSLSHGCTCCMDHGSGRKKRKRRQSQVNGPRVRHTSWRIPSDLSLEQQRFVQNCTLLIALRHKVYRLCQVLFPKLQQTWLINPDTENVDFLVTQITDVVKTLEVKTSGDDHRFHNEHCPSNLTGVVECKTESTDETMVIETLQNSKTGESSKSQFPGNDKPLADNSLPVVPVMSDQLNVDCSSVPAPCLHHSTASKSICSPSRFGGKLLNSIASIQNEQISTNSGGGSIGEESKDDCLSMDSTASQLVQQSSVRDLAEAVGDSDPMLPNLNCCLNSEPDMEIDSSCTAEIEGVMPLLECYTSDIGKSELSCGSPCTSEKTAFSSEDQWLVLDSIEEETASLPGLFGDEGELAPIAPSLLPFSEQSSSGSGFLTTTGITERAGIECKLPDTLPDYSEPPSSSSESMGKEPRAWESEFMKYLSGREAFSSSAGDSADGCVKSIDRASPSPSLITTAGEDSGVHSSLSDGWVRNQADHNLLDIKVPLCNDPHACLTRLRKQVMYLLKPLLPNLTFENNFDKFSDDVDFLVDLVTQSNETKEMRSTASPALSRT